MLKPLIAATAAALLLMGCKGDDSPGAMYEGVEFH